MAFKVSPLLSLVLPFDLFPIPFPSCPWWLFARMRKICISTPLFRTPHLTLVSVRSSACYFSSSPSGSFHFLSCPPPMNILVSSLSGYWNPAGILSRLSPRSWVLASPHPIVVFPFLIHSQDSTASGWVWPLAFSPMHAGCASFCFVSLTLVKWRERRTRELWPRSVNWVGVPLHDWDSSNPDIQKRLRRKGWHWPLKSRRWTRQN